MRSGMATMVIVFLVSLIAVLMIAGWQSKLFFSLGRNRAAADVIATGYGAESELFDIVARFLGEYPSAFSFPFTETKELEDGTELVVTGSEAGSVQTIGVVAKRLSATTNIQVSRSDSGDEITGEGEIVFALDCTGSMGKRACPSCTTTRMEELEAAMVNFFDALETTPGYEQIKVGVSVYTLNSDWLYTSYDGAGNPTGTPVTPESGLTIDQMRQAVINGFGESGEEESPACKHLLTYTNVGEGLVFAHDYLQTTKRPSAQQVEVLITDGEPNQRTPNAMCPVDVFCPGDGDYCCPGGSKCDETKPLSDDGNGWTCPVGRGEDTCTPYGRDFLACSLADQDTIWEPEMTSGEPLGIRDPDVDVYSVTVLENPPVEVKQIFENYSTHYYDLAGADEFSEILEDILDKIVRSVSRIRIKPVIPTPIN